MSCSDEPRHRETNRLDALARSKQPILACYLPIGDPAAPYADPRVYVDEGVDVLEVGVPTPDPVLDGPLIHASMRRAVQSGMTKERAAELLAGLRDLPGRAATVWMGYPTAAREPRFAEAVAASRADGLLLAGTPPGVYRIPESTHELRFVPHRPTAEQIADAVHADGYVMVAADDGVSGPRASLPMECNAALLARIRASGATVPLLLGFGIVDGSTARRAVDCGADGVIVGSAVLAAAMRSTNALARILRELRKALDG